jgi:SAM-dependent methyltransferase
MQFIMLEKGEAKSLEYIPCPRCGHENSRPVLSGLDRLHKIPGEYQASECLHCGLWFQNPRPIASRLTSLYPEDYLPHQKPSASVIKAGAARFLRRHLGYHSLMPDDLDKMQFDWHQLPLFDWVRKWQIAVDLIPVYIENGKLLEIGSASGARLLSLRRLGWQHLHGIELVPAAVERARAEGFEVICDQVEDALDQYSDGEFDVIISSMVLEHLYNPFQVVQMVAKKLKPGGQFIFSTVIRDSLDAKIFRDYWSGFDFPRHMIYFQKSDLIDMLRNQFEKITILHQSAPIDFIRPPLSRKEDGKGTLIDDLMLSIARSPLASSISLIFAVFGLTCRVSIYCYRKNQ